MNSVRTTLALPGDLYEGLKTDYRRLGFSRMGDLINEAIREYLHRRHLQEMNDSLERAAANPAYRNLLREVSEDLASVDAENLPPEY